MGFIYLLFLINCISTYSTLSTELALAFSMPYARLCFGALSTHPLSPRAVKERLYVKKKKEQTNTALTLIIQIKIVFFDPILFVNLL